MAKTKRIYLDYAAATPVRAEAARTGAAALSAFGNPSALHMDGIAAMDILEKSREEIAHTLQCRAEELIFTSGGTEGNNLAVFGSITNPQGAHIIVSAIEHPSVLGPAAALEQWGVKVTRVMPDEHGIIRPADVAAALTPATRLVSIGWANGEIGTVQPLADIARVVREYESAHGAKIIFHTDAGQAPLYLKSTANSLGVDVMTLDSGKLYGPRGIGALFIRHGVSLRPTLFGGGQEKGIRPGTENVALAAGFAATLTADVKERDKESKRLATLKEAFLADVMQRIPNAVINGGAKNTLPHIVNISIPNIDAEYIALALDHKGVSLSTKTSCQEGERESIVVKTLGGEPWRAAAALRFSLGRGTNAKELARAAQLLRDSI